MCRCIRGKTSRTLGSGDPGLATHAPAVMGSYMDVLSLGFLTCEAGWDGDNPRASTPAILPGARVLLPMRDPGGRVPSLLPSQRAGPRERRPQPPSPAPRTPAIPACCFNSEEKRGFPGARRARAAQPSSLRGREAATATPDPATAAPYTSLTGTLLGAQLAALLFGFVSQFLVLWKMLWL